MVRSHAAVGCPHAAAPATEAAAPEAAESSTAAPRRIAGTSTYGYEPMREAAMAAVGKSWRRTSPWLRPRPSSVNRTA
jgi:hypothetical protein